MIIKDDHGTILIDSRVSHLLIDQNGNQWMLIDEGDGLAVEILDSTHTNLALVAMGPRVVKIKPESIPRSTARSLKAATA
jgi:hypothetical protein